MGRYRGLWNYDRSWYLTRTPHRFFFEDLGEDGSALHPRKLKKNISPPPPWIRASLNDPMRRTILKTGNSKLRAGGGGSDRRGEGGGHPSSLLWTPSLYWTPSPPPPRTDLEIGNLSQTRLGKSKLQKTPQKHYPPLPIPATGALRLGVKVHFQAEPRKQKPPKR